jgi:hypothetical protein
MTTEQIQSALRWWDFYTYDQKREHKETIRNAITQALEIAKGDKVLVPREPTQEMIDAGIKAACNSKGIEMVLNQKIVVENEHFKCEIESLSYTGIDEYKAMIAVAEGDNK